MLAVLTNISYACFRANNQFNIHKCVAFEAFRWSKCSRQEKEINRTAEQDIHPIFAFKPSIGPLPCGLFLCWATLLRETFISDINHSNHVFSPPHTQCPRNQEWRWNPRFFSSRKDWYIAMLLYILRIHFPMQYHPYHFLRSRTSNPFTQNILFSKVESDDCGVDG